MTDSNLDFPTFGWIVNPFDLISNINVKYQNSTIEKRFDYTIDSSLNSIENSINLSFLLRKRNQFTCGNAIDPFGIETINFQSNCSFYHASSMDFSTLKLYSVSYMKCNSESDYETHECGI